ncbi:DNA gyrase/topoisomerase IV subunit A [Coleofasciculus sp.]|uniref:DNA gyrase/topoisomerase IV subunit A n=1 Tax=Coleofasciculus sp. TaxID=3100458 RepID=UPI003A15BF7A
MAKQLNLLATGQVIPTPLHAEMQQSYLEYAMSVIVGRALPDVCDGLKPVHRRILYAMYELGLTPDRPYRKCARVVGDVLGKYHPHGDQAVYDAMVRLIQDFSTRYPLLAGHGNFGSVDNDPPAAMRYTETRLSPISHEALLSEIGEATVDFIDNFDGSQQEPVVLPAQLPILLLNGCSGIAVGMATNIPPHNLGEIVDGLIALIDRPDLADEKLWKLIPGPDFPTGGEIIDTSGIRDAYSSGRGIIPVRGIAKVEEIQVGRTRRHRRTALIVTELPYQVNKAAWIEKIADLVNHGRLEGISDLRDESDRQGMRVVVELKRDADPRDVLKHLYKQTPLQSNFGAIMLALVNGQPRQLPLRQCLEEFLRFREQTLTRQYTYELDQKRQRRHLVEGLLICLNQLNHVIEILTHAPDGTTAKTRFQDQLNLSESQADAILAMPMRRLTGLERQKLQTEFEELTARIETLQELLSSRNELLKTLKKELRSLKRKYADPRRTKIRSPKSLKEPKQPKSEKQTRQKTKTSDNQKTSASKSPSPNLIETEAEQTVLEFTYQGHVQRLRCAPDPKSPPSLKDGNDFVIQTQQTTTQSEFATLTSGGKAYPLKVQDIPPAAGRKQGIPLTRLLPDAAQSETVITHFRPRELSESLSLILLTQQGRVKRLPATELLNLTARGLTVIKLKQEDSLAYVSLAQPTDDLIIATSNGRLLRFEINDQNLPIMGRTAQGNQALRLRRREQLVGCVAIAANENLLLVSEQGYGKRIGLNVVRRIKRGDLGTQALQFKTSTDRLMGVVNASQTETAVLLTSDNRVMNVSLKSVKLSGKDGCGDRLVKLKSNETIIAITAILP